jgi:hypothetical protein
MLIIKIFSTFAPIIYFHECSSKRRSKNSWLSYREYHYYYLHAFMEVR